MTADVIVHEVGPRDGLQVEKAVVPLETKIAWVEKLAASGVDVVQVGSFVNPKVVPQLADTDELFKRLLADRRKERRARLSALVLNERGLDRGLAAGVDYFCVGASASDTHSRKNTGMGTDEAVERIAAIGRTALAAGATVQVSIQSAFGCGYEGRVPDERVVRIAARFIDAGFRMFSLADTAGHATPTDVDRLFGKVHALDSDLVFACHFHDTHGLAIANAWAALNVGVRSFEAAIGGLGGCPFTALAGGNLCTEDFVHLLQRVGRRRDISLAAISSVACEAEEFFGRPLPGFVHRTGEIPTGAQTAGAGRS